MGATFGWLAGEGGTFGIDRGTDASKFRRRRTEQGPFGCWREQRAPCEVGRRGFVILPPRSSEGDGAETEATEDEGGTSSCEGSKASKKEGQQRARERNAENEEPFERMFDGIPNPARLPTRPFRCCCASVLPVS